MDLRTLLPRVAEESREAAARIEGVLGKRACSMREAWAWAVGNAGAEEDSKRLRAVENAVRIA